MSSSAIVEVRVERMIPFERSIMDSLQSRYESGESMPATIVANRDDINKTWTSAKDPEHVDWTTLDTGWFGSFTLVYDDSVPSGTFRLE